MLLTHFLQESFANHAVLFRQIETSGEQLADDMNQEKSGLTILMATYKGEDYIEEQLDSFANQSVGYIDLVVSDDSPDDGTVNVVRSKVGALPSIRARFLEGPQAGFVENFRSLILRCDPETEYIAFSDQDDIWLPDKTKRSIEWLGKQSADVPALYCGRTRMIDETGEVTGSLSPLFSCKPEFKNALVQSIAGGNTMTMNRAAFDVLKKSVKTGAPVAHDWWTYMVVCGTGGVVQYDPEPLTLYRQHGGNLIGENGSFAARKKRIAMILSGTWKKWHDVHLKLLSEIEHLLNEENRNTLHFFSGVRGRSITRRINFLLKSGVWRQTVAGSIALYLAVILNKV